ncbi:MAG: porin family protein [Bacteroidales bacterium]|nr:porin family protein [Bacteroidales bacterium]HOI33272.1 porin family protein [Bacteroidales bacterium]
MKKYLPLLFLGLIVLISSFDAAAQRRKVMNLPKYDLEPYHFGFILAANEMHYTLNLKDGFQNVFHEPEFWPERPSSDSVQLINMTPAATPGFTIGIVGNLRLANHFDLRFIPSLSFGERHMDYQVREYNNGADSLFLFRKSNASTFVEFPLHIKYRSKRLNNAAAYIIGGVNYRIDLASQKKNERDITLPGGGTETIIEGIRTNRNSVALEIGTGFDFYTNFFKFGVELKMSYGLGSIVETDNYIYTSSVESLKNKIFQISFTFE